MALKDNSVNYQTLVVPLAYKELKGNKAWAKRHCRAKDLPTLCNYSRMCCSQIFDMIGIRKLILFIDFMVPDNAFSGNYAHMSSNKRVGSWGSQKQQLTPWAFTAFHLCLLKSSL